MTPRIGFWGTFDLENYGDLLYPRIAERELLNRLPHAVVRSFAPYGHLHPVRLDAGLPAHPLGAWSSERAAELAGQLDCVLIGGGEIIHTRDELLAAHYGVTASELVDRAPSRFFIEALGPDLERVCPVIWHGVGIPLEPTQEEGERLRAALASREYITVRGETSRRRLAAVGVDKDVVVVPDSAFLLPRLFPENLLGPRLNHLRDLGWYPRDRNALLVQGSRYMIPGISVLASQIEVLLRRRGDLTPVLVGTGPCHGDHEFADALSSALSVPSYRLPEGVLVEDLVAAIWGSQGFIGISLHGNVTAFCFDKPHVALNLLGYSKLDDFALLTENTACVVRDASQLDGAFRRAERVASRTTVLEKLQRRIDDHFARVALLAREAATSRRFGRESVRDHRSDLRRAYEVRGQRMVAERSALTEAVVAGRAREGDLRAKVAQLEDALGQAKAEREQQAQLVATLELQLSALRKQLNVLQSSRSFRYTAPLRTARRRLRGLTEKRP